MSSYDIGLNIDHKTVLGHLRKAEYTKKFDVWVLHDLTLKNLIDWIFFIYESLLKRNKIISEKIDNGRWKMDNMDNTTMFEKDRGRKWGITNDRKAWIDVKKENMLFDDADGIGRKF